MGLENTRNGCGRRPQHVLRKLAACLGVLVACFGDLRFFFFGDPWSVFPGRLQYVLVFSETCATCFHKSMQSFLEYPQQSYGANVQ